jgi:hypothetical protein
MPLDTDTSLFAQVHDGIPSDEGQVFSLESVDEDVYMKTTQGRT